jgi:hypothetical protein
MLLINLSLESQNLSLESQNYNTIFTSGLKPHKIWHLLMFSDLVSTPDPRGLHIPQFHAYTCPVSCISQYISRQAVILSSGVSYDHNDGSCSAKQMIVE